MLNRIGALALLALSSSLVACSSPSSTPSAPTVDGQVVRGALALSSYSLDNAVVIARTADGRSFFAPVLANGKFAVTIPAGASARLSIANSTRKSGYTTVSRILWPGLHKTWARLDGTTASIALGTVHPARLGGAQIQDHGGSYTSGSSGSGSGGYSSGGSNSGGGSSDNGSDHGGSGGGYSSGGSDGNHGGGGDDEGSNDHGGHGSHACGTSSSGSSCVEADDCESDGTPVCAGAGEYDSECDGGSYATSDDDDHGSDVACGGGGGNGGSHASGDDDSSGGGGGSHESGDDDDDDDDSGGNEGGGYATGGSDNGGGADGGSGGYSSGGGTNTGGSAGGTTTGHTGSVPNGGSCTVCAECLSGLVCVASKCATRSP